MMKNNKKLWVKNGFVESKAKKGRTALTTRAFHKLMTFGSDLKFKFHYKLLRCCDHEPFGAQRRTDNRGEMGSSQRRKKTKRAKLVEIYLIKLICVSASPFQLFPFVFDLWFFFSLNAFPFSNWLICRGTTKTEMVDGFLLLFELMVPWGWFRELVTPLGVH